MPVLEAVRRFLAKSPHSPIRTSGEKKELPISSTLPVRLLERLTTYPHF